MRLLKDALHYLFPRRSLQSRIRLLSRDPSSEKSPYLDNEDDWTVRFFMAHGVAKTREDAIRLMKRYPGKPARLIIQTERRKRRIAGRWRRAWERLKRSW